MKRFISTKFFLTLQEASQKRINIAVQILEPEYWAFTRFLFSETAMPQNKVLFYNTLCYTHVEFAMMQKDRVLKKKCGRRRIHRQGIAACRNTDGICLPTNTG
jgi:hypothetical protein